MLEPLIMDAISELRSAAANYKAARLVEAEITRAVCTEKDENGKAKYGNPDARDAEIKLRLSNHNPTFPGARVDYEVATEILKALRVLAAQPAAVKA